MNPQKYNLIIPAAGKGRRLRPLTNNLPKALVKVGSTSILELQISSLPKNKINKIIFILGYMSNVVIEKINSLKIDIPISFYYNKNYEKTNCAASLLAAKEEMINGFILLNCDLLFRKNNLIRLIESEKKNLIGARKIDKYKTDLQKIYVDNGRIAKWADTIDGPNAEVMGPLKICSDDSKKIIEYYKSLSEIDKNKMHCFSLFSNCLDSINYHPMYIDDDEWNEIDTKEDLEKASIFY